MGVGRSVGAGVWGGVGLSVGAGELGCWAGLPPPYPRCDVQRRGTSDVGWAAQPPAVGVAGAREEAKVERWPHERAVQPCARPGPSLLEA